MFYDLMIADNGFDLHGFEKYIAYGSPDKGVLVLKFAESETEDFVKKLYESYYNSDIIDFNQFSDLCHFFDNGGYLYKYSNGSAVRIRRIGYINILLNFYFSYSRFKKIDKTLKRSARMSNKYNRSAVIKKFSVLPYKAFEYYSKEHSLTFKYRIKKAKSLDKPLVIYMSGAGCLGYDNFKQLYEGHTELHNQLKNYDCTFLIPQSPCQNFFSEPSVYAYLNAVKELIDKISADASVDKKRIYLIGTSYGGFCTWEMVYRYPDLFACGVPVMGALIDFDNKFKNTDFERFRKTPLWVAHSADDDNVKIDADDAGVAELEKIGVDVKYTRWDKYGHQMSSKFYKQEPWADWMFKQVKK